MRSGQVIMETIGDDPLMELLELDQIYGWSRRISVLTSLFREKRSNWPLFLVAGTIVVGLTIIGVAAYLYLA